MQNPSCIKPKSDQPPYSFGEIAAFGQRLSLPGNLGEMAVFGQLPPLPGNLGEIAAFGQLPPLPGNLGEMAAFGQRLSLPSNLGEIAAFGQLPPLPGNLGEMAAFGQLPPLPCNLGEFAAFGQLPPLPGNLGEMAVVMVKKAPRLSYRESPLSSCREAPPSSCREAPPSSCKRGSSNRATSRAKGGRRFKGYDYSRGAVFFITFCVAGRKPLFGSVSGDKVVLSPLGLAALETIERETRRNPGLRLYAWVIMPDHVHLRIYVCPGLADPLAAVGAFVGNVKRWTTWRAKQLGIALAWEQNYYDRLCVSREIIELVDKYIANNPLKWSLMHGPNPPLKVIEPFDSPLLPESEWWTAVGASGFLDGRCKLASIQLSRSILPGEVAAVVARCLTAVEKGYILVSTFISPAEQALKRALVARGAPMVRVVPDALATVYRPKEDEPGQFAAGRLLLLSRVAAAGDSRHKAWHSLNDAIAEIALASGGTALYVKREWRGAPLEWRFNRSRAV